VCPWRQGTPCGDIIASVKLSQPERLPSNLLQTARGARCREAVRAEACLVDLKDRHQPLQ
jgi:hypothetical protein